MTMGVPKTTQILFGLFLTNPSREVQLFPGGGGGVGADGPIPAETNRTSVFRGGGGLDHLTPLWICACAL